MKIILISLILLLGGLFVYNSRADAEPFDLEALQNFIDVGRALESVRSFGGFSTQQSSATAPNPALSNVSGTGTSSTATYNWGGTEQGQFATTTSIIQFGTNFSGLDLNIYVETASTTSLGQQSSIEFEILKTDILSINKPVDCASTTIKHGDLAWTDLATTKTSATKSYTYTTGTTTYKWLPEKLANVYKGITISLTDISAQCLKIYAHGASTTIWVQAKKR